MFSPRSPLSVLQYRNFRLLWMGLFISRIGSEMQVVAVNWHVYLLTSSAVSLGIIGLARFVPIFFGSFVSGVVTDIVDKTKVMLGAQFVMIAASTILVITSYTHQISPLIIYLMLALNSLAGAFDTPARQATIPHLVPPKEFVKAVSLNSIMWQSAIVLGPAIGGFVIAFFGVGAVYTINAISFVAVIIGLLLMTPIGRVEEVVEFSISSIKEGLGFVLKSQIIFSTTFLDFIATFFASATTLMPIYAKDILRVGPQGLGLLYSAPAVGAIIAGLLISYIGHLKWQGKVLLTAVSLYGIAIIFFSISRSFILSLFFLGLSGLGDGISSILRNTIRQLSTPNHLRGRMSSIVQIFFYGGPQLGEVESGFAAGLIGTPLTVLIGGIATLLTTLGIAYYSPKLRKYQGHEHVEIV